MIKKDIPAFEYEPEIDDVLNSIAWELCGLKVKRPRKKSSE